MVKTVNTYAVMTVGDKGGRFKVTDIDNLQIAKTFARHFSKSKLNGEYNSSPLALILDEELSNELILETNQYLPNHSDAVISVFLGGVEYQKVTNNE